VNLSNSNLRNGGQFYRVGLPMYVSDEVGKIRLAKKCSPICAGAISGSEFILTIECTLFDHIDEPGSCAHS
jgi:hypothetical protein